MTNGNVNSTPVYNVGHDNDRRWFPPSIYIITHFFKFVKS